jgi:glycolate oxidase FAD binding subunit
VDAALLDKLRAIVGPPHVLTGVAVGPYVVEGRTPEAAVFPGSVDEVRAVVEVAAAAGAPVMPWGGGTAAAVGTPPSRTGLVLGLGRLARILEHEPGDLTVTVEAGLTLAALQAALRAQGQWLSLDPPQADRATLGGIVAANAAGPRRHLYGTARDLVIGLTVVGADGALVRGGGKVVKNVAGYDLPKLFIGSYGTLGVIVTVTLKLRPLPDDERLVAVAFERLKDAAAAARALLGSDLIPNAVDLADTEGLAAMGLDLPAAAALLVGFDGLPEQVAWQCDELARLASAFGGHTARVLPAEAWPRLAHGVRAAWSTPAAVMRLVVLPAAVADVMEQGAGAARQRGLPSAWTAHAGVGIVTGALAIPPAPDGFTAVVSVLEDWRRLARSAGGFAILEWAPLPVKSAVPVWDDPGGAGRIMQRIKTQLDPHGLFNPGRFVAGI